MTRFDDLDRALTAYFDSEVVAPAPAGLLENALITTGRHRPRPAWRARLRVRAVHFPRSETARTMLIAAGLVALLLLIAGLALVGGSRKSNPPLIDSATPSPSASISPSTGPVAGTPLEDSFRATWLGNTRALPLLGTGAGPVSMAISGTGTSLSAANFAPGATFDSTISAIGGGRVQLVLDRESGGCASGAVGTYDIRQSDDGSLLDLSSVSDECATRAEALTRTWGRSLLAVTSRGSGFITSLSPSFSVSLPDKPLSSRTLDDFFEIGSPDGFGFTGYRNPVGFVDPCSTAEERHGWVPGADAFADFLQQHPALTTISRSETTVAGLRAIHIVIVGRSDYAPCPTPPDGFYLWTPKDCACHFVLGPGDRDSLYLVDTGAETLMFEVFPVDETDPIERQVIDSIRIPAEPPSD
jgi:hypothetical protein